MQQMLTLVLFSVLGHGPESTVPQVSQGPPQAPKQWECQQESVIPPSTLLHFSLDKAIGLFKATLVACSSNLWLLPGWKSMMSTALEAAS